MLKALLRVRIASLLSSMFRTSRRGTRLSLGLKLLIGLAALYVVGNVAMLFVMLFYGLCLPLSQAGLSWFYFALMAVMVIVIGFVGSLFATQSQLFEARDNELLLSMPVPPRLILISRVGVLLAINGALSLLIVLPAGIVYALLQPVTFAGVALFILASLLLPLIPLTFSCLLGWLIALIGSKVRYKTAITVVLSVALLIGYFIGVFQVQGLLEQLIRDGAAVAEALRRTLFPLYHFGLAIAGHSLTSFLLYALCAVIPFLLVYALLAHFFIRIATAGRSTARVRYREKALKAGGVRRALVARELRHFWASPMYILNGAMGALLSLLFAVVLLVKGESLLTPLQAVPGMEGLLAPIMTLALTVCAAMNLVSAPSVSLEGKSLWIAQSLPVNAGDILLAKAVAHIAVCLPPALLSALLCSLAVPAGAGDIALLFLVPAAMTVFIAFLGVVLNIHYPKLDWISETAAIKQGMSTMLTMFASLAAIGVPMGLYLGLLRRFLPVQGMLAIGAVLFLAAAALFYRHLCTRGKAIFESL